MATGCDGVRTRGLGELGRDGGADVRPGPFDKTRPTAMEAPDAGDEGVVEIRRVGVDGREFNRAAGELKFAGICGLEVGVDGLEI